MRFFPSASILALAGLLALAGCGKKAPAPDKPEEPKEDPKATRIGFFAPMSGVQKSFGNEALHGASLAVEQINANGGVLGHPIKLIVKDTQSRAGETETAVSGLIERDKVAVLIGEIATDRTLVAAPIAQANGIPMITPGATNEQITAVGDSIFRVCYTDAFQAGVMAKFARSIDVEKAAVLYDPSNPYSSGLAERFKQDFAANGGTVVAEGQYRAGDRDFTSQLNALKEKNPEVIFLPSYYAEAALIIQQARDVGVEAPFLGTDGWDSPEFLEVGGKAVNNSYFCSHFTSEDSAENVKSFVAAYTTKFGTPPPPLAALAYDAVLLAVDGLKRAGSEDSAAVKSALATTKDFQGVTGSITLDENRNPRKPGIVIRVDEGKFSFLERVDP